jgi:hypothetical protein
MGEPSKPDRESRERLLGILAELIAKDSGLGAQGAHVALARFLMPPVAPGVDSFPEPWAPTRAGVQLLMRRHMAHAGIDRGVEIVDELLATAPPTERKPATRIEANDVATGSGAAARFTLYFIGADDVVGTMAHEVGTIFAAMHRPDEADPYRTAEPPLIVVDPDRDLERGSVATIYLGLGVLAANAAFQQYSSAGRFNGGYVPLEYDVLRAGAVPMSGLAYLLAVQAIVRGATEPPKGPKPPQRDEVADWMKALDGQRASLCERLGIPADSVSIERPEVTPIDDELAPLDEPPPRPTAFRWQTHRGGVGFLTGTVMGIGVAFAVSRGMMPFTVLGGATAGHVIGRRVRAPRCSACATIVPEDATTCPKCGAALRGDIASLSERLEAEERLEDEHRDHT